MSSGGRKRGAAATAASDPAPAATTSSGRGKGKAAAVSPSAADADMDDNAAAAGASSNSAAAAGSAAAPAASSATGAGAVAGVKRANKSIRASDQKRKKLAPRCSSPSHFLMEYAGGPDVPSSVSPPSFLSSPLPSALSSDPSAPASTHTNESGARIDAFLHSIGSMYYRNHASLSKDAAAAGPAAEVWVAADYDKLEYPTLDLLLSPLRKPHVLDNWCPREIALFEAGICAVGKDFHAIARLLQTKSCKECVDFYYVWKKSSHYALWKNFGKPSKKPHANKEEQWKAIREQMMSGNNNANGTNTGGAAAAGAAGAPSTATTAAAQSALAATAAAAGGATLTVKKE